MRYLLISVLTVLLCLSLPVFATEEPEAVNAWRTDLRLLLDSRDTKNRDLLEKMAKHNRPEVRAAVAQMIPGELHEEGVPLLNTLSRDTDDRVSVAASAALIKIGGESTLSSLRWLITEGSLEGQRQTIVYLGDFKDARFIPEMGKLLGGEDPDIRAAVVTSFQSLHDIRTLPYLMAATGDSNQTVQIASIRTLDTLGDSSALPRLAALLKTEDLMVNAEVVRAMISLGGMSTFAKQIEEAFFAGNEDLRALALKELKNNPTQTAFPIYKKLVENPDASARVRQSLVQALRDASYPEADGWITLSLKDPSDRVRATAIQALTARDVVKQYPKILAAANDPSKEVRSMVASSLGKLPQSKPVPTLLQLARDQEAEVRGMACISAIDLGTSEALEVARITISDTSSYVRMNTVSGLSMSPMKEATAILRIALDDEELKIKVAAIRILGDRNDKESVDRFRDFAKSETEMLRRAAQGALKKMNAR